MHPCHCAVSAVYYVHDRKQDKLQRRKLDFVDGLIHALFHENNQTVFSCNGRDPGMIG